MGESKKGRKDLVLEATTRTAHKNGDWVLILPYRGPAINEYVNIELGNSKEYQLYNLKEDAGQQNNLAHSNIGKLQELRKLYEFRREKVTTKVQQLELK